MVLKVISNKDLTFQIFEEKKTLYGLDYWKPI